jgi:hypothetical protein
MKKLKTLNEIPVIAQYLSDIGAEARSFRTAVIKETHGSSWTDMCTVKFAKDGTVSIVGEHSAGYLDRLPDDITAKAIADAMAEYDWPELKLVRQWLPSWEPVDLREADPERIFVFHDKAGNIIMKQLRTDKPRDGGKTYIGFTLWDDDVVRMMEPDGALPLWGLEQLNRYENVFLHEGAKAARRMARMVSKSTAQYEAELANNPWGAELAGSAHLGWIGGADNPNRTDVSILKTLGVKRVYIVGDNDRKGQAAVKPIARNIDLPTYHVQLGDQWPRSWDMGDNWPENMFNTIGGERYYIGPSFRAALQPATFATKKIKTKTKDGKEGKPIIVLREHFKDQWVYVPHNDVFVNVEFPEMRFNEAIANKKLAAFSDMNNVCAMIVREYNGTHLRLTYRPDVAGRLIIDRESTAINLHTPSHIEPKAGDPKPWIDFLTYMFPHESERIEVEKWCATLIERLDVRMEYGLLMVSEAQGVGKTTLGQTILAPLVGMQNTGFPSEKDVTDSNFNGWLANKRLVVIGEIYSGHSWKAYNNLKSYITDKNIDVNEKHQRVYKVENWAHIIACSNSKRALRMEEDDRRWFYPEVTEKRWPRKKFDEFFQWLNGGGLQIIRHWAKHYGNYVSVGERAPMTERKKALIADSRTDAQKEVLDLAMAMNNSDDLIALTMKDIEAWVKASIQGKVFDSDLELRKAMHDGGAVTYGKRLTIEGRTQYVIVNKALWSAGAKLGDDEFVALIRSNVKKANDILGANM